MTAQQELKKFMAKYEPGVAAQARKALGKMRKMVPNAIEMVYDNFNWLVIGFVPSERPSDAVFSILLAPDHVTLCFLQGSTLPDPGKRLQGGGKLVRNVRLEPVEVLDEPEIRELIQVAMNRARVGFDPKMKRKMVVRAVSKKQRPRRVMKKTERTKTKRKG
jgi:hypothetical protein